MMSVPDSLQGPPSKPRLLIVVPDAAFFVSHRLNLAIGAIKHGYEVAVACPTSEEVDEITREGALHYPIAVSRSGLNPFQEARTLVTIYRVARNFRPDVMHVVTSKAVIYGGIVGRFMAIPTLAAISGLGRVFLSHSLKSRVLRTFASLGYGLALSGRHSTVIFQNSDDLQLFRDAGILRGQPVEMIPGSGVDLELIRPQEMPKGELIVGLPARLIRDKGVVEFVEAARILKRRGSQARFRLIGDPDPNNPTSISRDDLETWIGEGLVDWKPHTRDIGAALGACHVIALPSYREGFPKTLIDAAAAGRVCAASDVPGCRHAVVEGETGYLFRPRDSLSLANCLEGLIQNPDRVVAMGKAARKHAERCFDVRLVTERHLALYDKLSTSAPK